MNGVQQQASAVPPSDFEIALADKTVRQAQHRPRFGDPLQLLPRGLIRLYSIWIGLTYPFASKGRNLSFHFTSQLDRQRSVRISLGSSIGLKKDAWLNVATEDPTGEPVIVIDDNCSIGYGSIISAKNRIHLERDVLVGQQVLIVDHNHRYEDTTLPIVKQGITEGGRIRIGQGSWIGRGAAIICSRGQLTIGRNCVIAVNTVVTRSIPDYCLIWGNPATIIRQYDPETRAWRMGPTKNRTKSSQAASVPTGK
jgi:acetyltransferase-like isoleucine patch superfamily enzyme